MSQEPTVRLLLVDDIEENLVALSAVSTLRLSASMSTRAMIAPSMFPSLVR